MTNWQTFKIKFKKKQEQVVLSIFFGLDNYVRYENENRNVISCVDVAPFKDFEIGDYLEIDLDKTAIKQWTDVFNDVSIVRKVSSDEIVRRNNNNNNNNNTSVITSMRQFRELGDQVMNRAEQSGGQMEAEFIARQEYRTDGTISAQQLGWVYRHK